jgi:starch synthase
VVRRTGGLADSVEQVDTYTRTGTGFLFDRPAGVALRDALWSALELYEYDREAFDGVRLRGMARDFSWDCAVREYIAVCERARLLVGQG